MLSVFILSLDLSIVNHNTTHCSIPEATDNMLVRPCVLFSIVTQQVTCVDNYYFNLLLYIENIN